MRNVFRKEIKYVIHETSFIELKPLLMAFMRMDSHSKDMKYRVRSLYFDSASDIDFHDNLDGVMEKRKIRIRTYDMKSDFALLEYKCKSGSDSRKMSIKITKSEALELEKGHFEVLLSHKEDLATFLYDKMTRNVYRPKTVVDYDRTAFTYPVSDVRITYDHNIKASMTSGSLYNENVTLYPTMIGGYGVLEVKYNDFLVRPLQEIVEKLDSLPEAMSKYSQARFLTN